MAFSGRDRGPLAMTDSAPAELARLADRLALRPKEAAQALGIGERTLRNILPELPHVRVGGVVLLPVEGLRRWLEEQSKTEQGRAEQVAGEVLQAIGDR